MYIVVWGELSKLWLTIMDLHVSGTSEDRGKVNAWLYTSSKDLCSIMLFDTLIYGFCFESMTSTIYDFYENIFYKWKKSY